MDRIELEERTRSFASAVLRLARSLPKERSIQGLGEQLVRSGTSIGANYREAGRADSREDFVHKLGIVEKEASETAYWLELVHDAGVGDPAEIKRLKAECGELQAIFASSRRTARRHRDQGKEG